MAKNTGYGQKAVKAMEILNRYPDAADAYVAAKVGCHPTYVKQIRKKMAHAQQEEPKHVPETVKPEPMSEEDKAVLQKLIDDWGKVDDEEDDATNVDVILDERGSRYGSFYTHAEITQRLKQMAYNHIIDGKLAPDQIEALDMIFHKIGRIINGDPDYVDSWVDIAGYAKLVADRLQGIVR